VLPDGKLLFSSVCRRSRGGHGDLDFNCSAAICKRRAESISVLQLRVFSNIAH
jgi:hypothetical protein